MSQPVPHQDVVFRDCFWGPRIATVRQATLPALYGNLKRTGQLDAWTWKPGAPKTPHIFWDSDLAKWIEAVSYSLACQRDRGLERRVDAVIERLEAAQAPDGYLNSHFLKVAPQKRWSNLRDHHELYCAGHLIEAAVAYQQATGKGKLLELLIRYVEHIDRRFGTEEGKCKGYCGHPEIELALIRLFRHTREKRHLRLASYFVDQRGAAPAFFHEEARTRGEQPGADGGDQLQAHLPVRGQKAAVGHAVRALYLYSAMADLAAELGDPTLRKACRRLWLSVVRRRMYVIGGVGSSRVMERFTFDYDLPNEEAYAETCANIGLLFFAHRMLLSDPDGEYADVLERALYNGVLSGISLDGKRFFYENRLAVHPEYCRHHKQHASSRQEWFGCACCPPNIARVLASLGRYVYSLEPTELLVHLYVQGSARLAVGGQQVLVEQQTRYPWEGRVLLTLTPEREARFTLALRIPGWCRTPRLKVGSQTLALAGLLRKGYARIERIWRRGDRVELTLPMPVERIEAHPAVRQDAGQVALQRGPLVYCLEELDNGPNLGDLALPRRSRLVARFDPRLLGGATVISGKGRCRDTANWSGQLYRPVGKSRTRAVRIKAVPYCLWNNRKTGQMRVWIREG